MENKKNELDRIKNTIIDFYNDPLYQELNAYYSKKTIFNILKIERNENRHSAFLAWLLDVNGSHGLGEEPLKRFMRLLAKMDESDRYNEPFLVCNYQIENVKVVTEQFAKVAGQKKTGRVDVFVKFDYMMKPVKVDGNNKQYHVRIIIENKIYTNEHDDQTKLYFDWVKQECKRKHSQTIIGVYLAPEKPKTCSGDSKEFNYVKITYQDILQDLLEPLLKMEMSSETRAFIVDYIVNLGQPVKDNEDEGGVNDNQDTILAIPKTNERIIADLYKNNQELLDASLYANCYERNERQLQTVFRDYNKFEAYSKDALAILKTFWNSNSTLLRIILDTSLKKRKKEIALEKDISEDDVLSAINILLRLNESSRYLVYSKNGVLINDNKKPSSMGLSSLYIFRSWLDDHPNASLGDIRDAFPVEKCIKKRKKNYLYPYQYLFYKKTQIIDALKYNKAEDRTYYNAPLDEDNCDTIKANKYLTWDFYDNDKYCLVIQGEKVLSMKMWLKDEFELLVDHAKNQFGIMVKEQ